MKMKLVRINSTGREYAMPASRFSELPCLRIEDGKPKQTSFSYGELSYMIKIGCAEEVGEVTLTFTLERSK